MQATLLRDRPPNLPVSAGDLADAGELIELLATEVADLAERASGAAGIIVPSYSPGAAADAKNLVLWQWSDALPHQVTIHDPDGDLPRDDSSWRRR